MQPLFKTEADEAIENLQAHNRDLQQELEETKRAASVLIETLKRGSWPSAAMYDLENLL